MKYIGVDGAMRARLQRSGTGRTTGPCIGIVLLHSSARCRPCRWCGLRHNRHVRRPSAGNGLMLRYILRRLLYAIVILISVSAP